MLLQRLTDGVNTVSFSPLQDRYVEGRQWETNRWRSASGRLFSYQWWTDKLRVEIPLYIYNFDDADQLNAWCKDDIRLKFWWDLQNHPMSWVKVLIVNDSEPMQQFSPRWKKNYTGTIILEQR